MDQSGARLVSIILALSVVVGAWLLFEHGQQAPALPTKTPAAAPLPEQTDLPDANASPPRRIPSPTANSNTIYKCRSSAGVAYRSEPCHSHETEVRSVTSTIVHSNPNELTALKEKADRMEADRRGAGSPRIASIQPPQQVPDKRIQCDMIDQEISVIDSKLRQPHTPDSGDDLTAKRKEWMDKRFSVGC